MKTLLVAIACIAVVFEFLALQLQSGRDPALGSASTSPVPAKVRPRKKIIITKVIPAADRRPNRPDDLQLRRQHGAGARGDLDLMSNHDLTFNAMGCEVRLLIGDPLPGSPPAWEAAKRERLFIERFDAALSRFNPDSELTAFNEDPRETVPASALLRQAVQAGLWAAERSGGLVDPTLGRRDRGSWVRRVPCRGRAGTTGGRARERTRAPSGAPPSGRRSGASSRSTTRSARSGVLRGWPSTPAAAARALPRTSLPRTCAATRASSWIAAGMSASADSDRARSRSGPRPSPDRRRAGGDFRRLGRGDRDLGARHSPMEAQGRRFRPSPARSEHRRACLDRAGRRHRTRPDRPGGRDSLQGGAAQRSGRRGASCSPSTAECWSTTMVTSRSPAR